MKIGNSSALSAIAPTFRDVLETSAVRQRITEHLGGHHLEDATCLFLGRLDPHNPSRFERHPASDLHPLLNEGCEITRSLGDRESMLVHLDIEYVNFDDPAAAFIDPRRAFLLQEPLVDVIEERLLEFGIQYLHLVTGQGHHFVWKIRKDSPVAKSIAELEICNTLELELPTEPLFAHVALLMEYLAHLIKSAAAAVCLLPVEIKSLHVAYLLSTGTHVVSLL